MHDLLFQCANALFEATDLGKSRFAHRELAQIGGQWNGCRLGTPILPEFSVQLGLARGDSQGFGFRHRRDDWSGGQCTVNACT
ncbi:MAG TPA: hypothetical protein VLI43_15400 [Gemmatimonadaceae bacterium]|nr:hypothetical protein [Gemmatimonadaceae bacterium]